MKKRVPEIRERVLWCFYPLNYHFYFSVLWQLLGQQLVFLVWLPGARVLLWTLFLKCCGVLFDLSSGSPRDQHRSWLLFHTLLLGPKWLSWQQWHLSKDLKTYTLCASLGQGIVEGTSGRQNTKAWKRRTRMITGRTWGAPRAIAYIWKIGYA